MRTLVRLQPVNQRAYTVRKDGVDRGAEVLKMQKCRSVALAGWRSIQAWVECEDKGPRRCQKKTRYDKAKYHFVFLISFIFTYGVDTSFVFAYTSVDVDRISIVHFTKLLFL